MTQMLRIQLLCALCLSISVSSLRAESPFVSYIFPAGGQQGTTVNFNVGGHYLHESCAFEMLGPGVQATGQIQRAADTRWFEGPLIPLPESQQKEDYPKDQTGSVTIAADAPLGMRGWRVWTSQGACDTMKFIIGDLPEIVEAEIEGDPIPTAVNLPVTINGRIFPREDVDVWKFEGRAGNSYTCEVMANRLGSPLDSRLEVIGPAGNRIAENTDGIGADSFLRFTAPSDGTYQVRIHDISFDGLQHFVYRLTITDGVYVDHIFPLGGRRGSTVKFQIYGQNVSDGTLDIQLPTAEDSIWLHSIQQQGLTSNRFAIQLGDLDEHVETEPNDDATKAPILAVPAVFNGRVDQPGDVDHWRFVAKKDEVYVFEVQAERLGSHLDSVLVLTDAEGKELARNDDIEGKQTDSRIQFTIPADGTYTLSVSERFASRGGLRFAYRLIVTPPAAPDFRLNLLTDVLNVNRGGEAKLKIAVERIAGFAGEIGLSFEGLPSGVTVAGDKIEANKNEIELTFKADATTKIGPVGLRIVGSAQIAEQPISHDVVKAATSPFELAVDRFLLAVTLPTPFKFAGSFQTNYAARGSTFVKHFTIDRGGFSGPIEISLADRQTRHLQGVTGPTVVVPAGEAGFVYAIKLPPWMEIGRTSRTCLMATGVVEEPDGSKHKVCYSSDQQNDQLIVLVDPGQLEVRAEPRSLLAAPGISASVNISIGRGQSLDLPVTVELLIPAHVRGVTANSITIERGQTEGKMEIQFAANDLGPFNIPLTIVATALPDGRFYTAETNIEVVLQR